MTAQGVDLIKKAEVGVYVSEGTVTFRELCMYYQVKADTYLSAVAACYKQTKKAGLGIIQPCSTKGKPDYILTAAGVRLITSKFINSSIIKQQIRDIQQELQQQSAEEETIVENTIPIVSICKVITIGDHKVRVVGTTEEPWFHGQDLLRWLGYAQIGDTVSCSTLPLQRLSDDVKTLAIIEKGPATYIVSKEGVRQLILRRIADYKQKYRDEFTQALENIDGLNDIEEDKTEPSFNYSDYAPQNIKVLYQAMKQSYAFLVSQYGSETAREFIKDIQKGSE